MKAVLDVGVFLVTVLMMVTVGMKLPVQHFREVPRLRWFILFLLIVPVLILPTVAYVCIRLLGLPPYLSAGILLMAACPVGDIANFYILLGRGNAPVTFIVNTLTCLFSAATMWLIFQGYHLLPSTSFDFAVPPGALVYRITLMAALPVLSGMLLRRFLPAFVEKSAHIFQHASFAGIAVLLAYILVVRRGQLEQQWRETSIAASIFIVLAMGCGLGLGSLFRLKGPDLFTATVIFAVRNVGLAMAVSISLLNRVEYAVFATVYFITEIPVLLIAIAIYRRISRTPISSSAPCVAIEAES